MHTHSHTTHTHARTHTHTHTVGLLKDDQPVTNTPTYLHSTQTQATNIFALSGIRTLSPSNRLQTYAVDSSAIGIGRFSLK